LIDPVGEQQACQILVADLIDPALRGRDRAVDARPCAQGRFRLVRQRDGELDVIPDSSSSENAASKKYCRVRLPLAMTLVFQPGSAPCAKHAQVYGSGWLTNEGTIFCARSPAG
jgi:hypothetical protein